MLCHHEAFLSIYYILEVTLYKTLKAKVLSLITTLSIKHENALSSQQLQSQQEDRWVAPSMSEVSHKQGNLQIQ